MMTCFLSFHFLRAKLKIRGVKRVYRKKIGYFLFSFFFFFLKNILSVCYSVGPPPASQSSDSSRHINMRKRTLAPASLYQTLRAKGTTHYIEIHVHYILSYIIISPSYPPLPTRLAARVALRNHVCLSYKLHDRRGSCSSLLLLFLFSGFFKDRK